MTWRWTRCAGPRSNVDPSGANAKGRTGKFAMAVAEEERQIGRGATGEEEQAMVLVEGGVTGVENSRTMPRTRLGFLAGGLDCPWTREL